MNLVSMKVEMQDCAPCPPDAYGYGLRICLNDDQCEALGIKGPIKAGTVVQVVAMATVVRCEESTDADGDDTGTDIRLDLQITDMAIEGPADKIDAKALYPNSSMEA